MFPKSSQMKWFKRNSQKCGRIRMSNIILSGYALLLLMIVITERFDMFFTVKLAICLISVDYIFINE